MDDEQFDSAVSFMIHYLMKLKIYPVPVKAGREDLPNTFPKIPWPHYRLNVKDARITINAQRDRIEAGF